MTKVDGVALSSIWDDMKDAKREIVLRQVVDILLELASQRFDKVGMLFQQGSHADSGTLDRRYNRRRPLTSVIDYWLTLT
jgi:hypothetical protein